MEKRQLGQTDLHLTTVGLGTWALGGPWEYGWGPQDDEQALRTIGQAMDLGINWLDTAPAYGAGHAETLIGQALGQRSDRPLIATKCGLICDRDRRRVFALAPDAVRRQCEDSLRRLRVEQIDLYQMHKPIPDDQIEGAWETLAHLKEEGKVRHIGVCSCGVSQLDRLGTIAPVESLQSIYSMLHRDIEVELIDYCCLHHMGLLGFSPLGRGLLTGRFNYDRLVRLARDDHRHNVQDFQEPAFSATLALVEQLLPIAAELNVTLAQFVVAWAARRREMTSVIVGARRPGQIVETVTAGDIVLPEDHCQRVDALLAARLAQINRLKTK